MCVSLFELTYKSNNNSHTVLQNPIHFLIFLGIIFILLPANCLLIQLNGAEFISYPLCKQCFI